MTVLFAGGEMGAFVPSDSTVIEATSMSYDSAFARCSMITLRSSNYAETPTFSTTADIWIHFDVDMSATSASGGVVTAFDGGGIARVRLYSSAGTSSTWKVQTSSDGSTWADVNSGITIDSTARQTVDMHIVSNTSSGSIKLYVAGTLRINSGTINLSGYSGVAKLQQTGRGSGLASEVGVSQVIVASEPTIGWRLGTLVMSGQGATHTFTTGGYANVDEMVYSDADFINSATAAQEELFTATPIPSFTGYTIKAIALYARAKNNASGPTQMQLSLRSGGTTYHSSTKSLDVGYAAIGNIWETNPATSAAFLSSEIAALQYGVLSVA
jgi:hypothetical protein